MSQEKLYFLLSSRDIADLFVFLFLLDLKNVSFFVPRLGKKKDCSWLASSPNDIPTLCVNNSPAYNICEETCSACSDGCSDSESFLFVLEGSRRSCKWLSVRYGQQAIACKSDNVSSACQETCDTCPQPSSTPSRAPTRNPTRGPRCFDDDFTNFNVTIVDGKPAESKGCIWLRSTRNLFQYGRTLCSPRTGAAYSVCAESCKKCSDILSDSVSYRFTDRKGILRDCKWLSGTVQSRRYFCSNKGAKSFCEDTCESIQPVG